MVHLNKEAYGRASADQTGARQQSSRAFLAKLRKDDYGHDLAWKVKIEGHTDNLGGEAYNMALPARRPEAVMKELATPYQVTSDRLSSGSFDARRPKGTNETAEGRRPQSPVQPRRQ